MTKIKFFFAPIFLFFLSYSCTKKISNTVHTLNQIKFKHHSEVIDSVYKNYFSSYCFECIKCIMIDGSSSEAKIILFTLYDLKELKRRMPSDIVKYGNDTIFLFTPLDVALNYENGKVNYFITYFSNRLKNVNLNKKRKLTFEYVYSINISEDTLFVDRKFPRPIGSIVLGIEKLIHYKFPLKEIVLED